MPVVLIECPGDRRVVIVGRVLVYADDPADPECDNRMFDADLVAERLARADGAGGQVHRVRLPADFTAWDEDGPLPRFAPEDVAGWWAALCEAEAGEAAGDAPPPAYPTLAEQLLGVVAAAGLEVTDEVRRLAAELERVVLAGTGGGR